MLPTPVHHNPDNLRRVAGEAFFRAAGADGWTHLGDVVLHQLRPVSTTRTIRRATRHGIVTARIERVVAAGHEFEIDLQEWTPEAWAFLLFGSRADDAAQAAAAGLNVVLNNVAHRLCYDLERVNVSNVAATCGGAALSPGDDFIADPALGTIRFTQTGLVAAGAAVTVTFDCAEADRWRMAALDTPQRDGTLRVVEWSQAGDGTPSAEIWIPCSLRCDDAARASVEDTTSLTIKATATGPVRTLHPAPSILLVGDDGEELFGHEGQRLAA